MDCGEVVSAHAETDRFDVEDPELTRYDMVAEGARRDGVEIVHYVPRFPVPGTLRERRIVRAISFLFLLSFLFGLAFVVVYIWWPWKYEPGTNIHKLYTPLLGVTLGLCLACLGLGMISWGKKLLPEEIAVQDRHDGPSEPSERKLTGETMLNMVDELGIKRRPMLTAAAVAPLAILGAAAVAPLVGGLIKNPHNPNIFMFTGWDPNPPGGPPVALTRQDGTKIRPEDVSVGGQMTVFPGIPGGATNEYADSPTLLIHLRENDAEELHTNLPHVPRNIGYPWGNFVAYSKICTHAGCPASLYEQQTNRLLCPCHQSQFNTLDNARPIFGPATRHLPMLPLAVDADGFFVAGVQQTPGGPITGHGFWEAVGPGFWERP
jgi:ubiquinol-cytochrome c reductase iron-sulfur subunit